MFERLDTPQDVYNYKLGAALKMEREVLDILDDNIDEAHDDSLKALFRHHRQETEGQVANIERIFGMFGWEVDDSPCPTIEALQKEGKSNAKKTDDALIDGILLQSATEVEHHEIGVYENLIINARAMGRDDVVGLLQQNLEQERHTLEEVEGMEERLASISSRQML